MIGLVDRHSLKSCALLLINASDAALGSTIPSQLDLMLKLRVLFFLLLPSAKVWRPVDSLLSRYDVLIRASPPKQMQAKETRVNSQFSRKNESYKTSPVTAYICSGGFPG